ncbi:hypothetical protein F4803DRAFT_374166 [Xylaria telfairii]|nr:hypothetical protein F4803DRAFT_374166 [Xylaria telfairii]
MQVLKPIITDAPVIPSTTLCSCMYRIVQHTVVYSADGRSLFRQPLKRLSWVYTQLVDISNGTWAPAYCVRPEWHQLRVLHMRRMRQSALWQRNIDVRCRLAAGEFVAKTWLSNGPLEFSGGTNTWPEYRTGLYRSSKEMGIEPNERNEFIIGEPNELVQRPVMSGANGASHGIYSVERLACDAACHTCLPTCTITAVSMTNMQNRDGTTGRRILAGVFSRGANCGSEQRPPIQLLLSASAGVSSQSIERHGFWTLANRETTHKAPQSAAGYSICRLRRVRTISSVYNEAHVLARASG